MFYRKRVALSVLVLLTCSVVRAGVTVKKTVNKKDDVVVQQATVMAGKQQWLLAHAGRVDEQGRHVPVNDYERSASGFYFRRKGAWGNWYWKGDGFIRLMLDGKQVLRTAPAELTVVDQGEVGIVDVTWTTDKGKVTLRTVVRDGQQALQCRLTLEPTVEPKSIQLKLTNYPNYHRNPKTKKRELGSRLVVTPTRTVGPHEKYKSEKLELNETALFFYNSNMPGYGPSAMVFDRDGLTGASLIFGSAVWPTLTFKGDTREIRFALWVFDRSVRWQDGLEAFKEKILPKANDLLKPETFKPAEKVRIVPE